MLCLVFGCLEVFADLLLFVALDFDLRVCFGLVLIGGLITGGIGFRCFVCLAVRLCVWEFCCLTCDGEFV